ncbi:hypothetical protein BDY19DRAFT_680074 [Irpex rosettiformis]|uniref:Uncharacterized protein n=1 Tax=Irpex rosettiformis TaxID=378272 RepID=A0ACB8U9K6_9APHY|nr:hypothetical protein BDY19DRAFT_680074 [Irpex rosettiformis]
MPTEGCRRDEFLIGYGTGDTLLTLCDHDAFCSDDGSGCRGLVANGNPSEMNRDELCAPMVFHGTDAENSSIMLICLFSTCMHVNITIGQRFKITQIISTQDLTANSLATISSAVTASRLSYTTILPLRNASVANPSVRDVLLTWNVTRYIPCFHSRMSFFLAEMLYP